MINADNTVELKNLDHQRSAATNLLGSMSIDEAVEICVQNEWQGTLHMILNMAFGKQRQMHS